MAYYDSPPPETGLLIILIGLLFIGYWLLVGIIAIYLMLKDIGVISVFLAWLGGYIAALIIDYIIVLFFTVIFVKDSIVKIIISIFSLAIGGIACYLVDSMWFNYDFRWWLYLITAILVFLTSLGWFNKLVGATVQDDKQMETVG